MVSVCIACGCDDLNACIDAGSGRACHWLRTDSIARVGVCSACPEALDAFDAGDRQVRVQPQYRDSAVRGTG